jgi:dolichol-phosphate mannosyltransferase
MKILVAVFAYNEGVKIIRTLRKFPQKRDYDLLIVDDGSDDNSLADIQEFDATVFRHEKNLGIGASIRDMLKYALAHEYDIAVITAGNNKDDPSEIPRLLEPIIQDSYDFIQGSRYLSGGSFGNMPFYRRIATQYVHPMLFSFISRRKITDSTNGFRAIRLSILDNPEIDINQDWLDQYELEPYLFYKAIKSGYNVKEVPVTKIYPQKELGYTKMKPFTGWWSILRPLFLLALGLKK